MNKQSFAHLDSGNVEYYTPPNIIEAARKTLGVITLDPASSAVANARVRAIAYYSPELGLDGLAEPWFGTVWLNHPFSKGEKQCKKICNKEKCRERGHHIDTDIPGNAEWVNRLVTAYVTKEIESACCITWANMSEKWFSPLLEYPHCIPYGRVHYYKPDGEQTNSANKGSVITYLGRDIPAFIQAFQAVGKVYMPVS